MWQDVFLSAGRSGEGRLFLCDIQCFAARDMNNITFKQWTWRMNTSDGAAEREILE